MGKKYLYVAGDSFSAVGGNSIADPYTETDIQHRRHLKGQESLKPWQLEIEMEKNNKLYRDALQKERDSQWNVQLGKLLNLEIIYGGAIVGGSNKRSVNKLRNFLLSDERAKDSVVIWQWTTTERDLVYFQKYAYWLSTIKNNGSGDNFTYWNSESDNNQLAYATHRLDSFGRSDLIDAYYLIEETKLLHLLSENVGAQFFAFDGMVNIKNYLGKIKGSYCPMYPSCSEYGRLAISENGFLGIIKTFDRLHRCSHDLENYDVIIFDGEMRYLDEPN